MTALVQGHTHEFEKIADSDPLPGKNELIQPVVVSGFLATMLSLILRDHCICTGAWLIIVQGA